VIRAVDETGSVIETHKQSGDFQGTTSVVRVTPALKAGVSDHVWSLDEVIALLA